MPCLEPDKNISKEAQSVLKSLAELQSGTRREISDKTAMSLPLIARKARELIERGLAEEKSGSYTITDKGRDALSALEKNE